ncbi:unnamed protein product, partial [Prorocentrum cordatum]
PLPQRTRSDARSPGLSAPWPREVPRGPGGAAAKGARGGAGAACPAPATSLPVPSLEIDFVAGPRMGEKLVLTDRGPGEHSGAQRRGHGPDFRLVSGQHLEDPLRLRVSWKPLAPVRQRLHQRHVAAALLCAAAFRTRSPAPGHIGAGRHARVHRRGLGRAELTHWWLPSAACGVLAGLR